MNATYRWQFSGKSAYFLTFAMDVFHPGNERYSTSTFARASRSAGALVSGKEGRRRRRRTREPPEFFAVYVILNGYLDFGKVVEDVEFREVEAIVSVYQAGVLHDDQVEPATAPSPSGGNSVFSSDFLEVHADVLYAT